MTKLCKIHCCMLGLLLSGSALSITVDEKYRITFGIIAPPAVLVVTDSMGRRSGVNYDVPMTEVGLLDISSTGYKTGVMNEIPDSYTDYYNIADQDPDSPDVGQPMPGTLWSVIIRKIPSDAIARKYVVEYHGIESGIGVATVALNGGDTLPAIPRTGISMLFKKGVVKKIEYVFTPGTDKPDMNTRRLVQPGELLASVKTVCSMALISPDGICNSLAKKADAIDRAVLRGNNRAAAAEMNGFLNELKAQGGKHVKEPALTILREEAEALLKDLERPVGKKKGGKKAGK
jgi:hypothetical protein